MHLEQGAEVGGMGEGLGGRRAGVHALGEGG